jgi:alpha-1,2-glucosyltransferase
MLNHKYPLPLLVVIVTAGFAGWGVWQAWGLHEYFVLDESQVYGQVELFLQRRWELLQWPGDKYPAAAMFPGFQAVLSMIATLTGFSSVAMVRIYAFGFSLLYTVVVYLLARQFVDREIAVIRTAQAYMLPILFPFHFLMYTDTFSQLVILSAFLAFLRGRYNLGGVLMVLALLVRQTNIMFLVFLWCFTAINEYGFRPQLMELWRHMQRCWLLVLAMIAFVAFILIHGRVGLDDPTNHPLILSHGNLAFSLVVVAILFLPVHLQNLPQVGRWMRTHWLVALALIGLALVVGQTYSPLHFWNKNPGFLRNELLHLLTLNWQWRMVFAITMVWALFSVTVTPLVRQTAVLIYPFWFLRLLPAVLVEPRYYISSITLFLLLRKADKPPMELALWAWFAVLSAGLNHAITTIEFFIL